jgi:hypothetical protein
MRDRPPSTAALTVVSHAVEQRTFEDLVHAD